jgi:predicted  nucleic acid-binding Zn-ribbon protein
MVEQGRFKCLRCGLEYATPFDPETEPQERSCPKCRSNSVRHLKEKKPGKKAKADSSGTATPDSGQNTPATRHGKTGVSGGTKPHLANPGSGGGGKK